MVLTDFLTEEGVEWIVVFLVDTTGKDDEDDFLLLAGLYT